jgi:hypothetical protein
MRKGLLAADGVHQPREGIFASLRLVDGGLVFATGAKPVDQTCEKIGFLSHGCKE